MQGLRLNYLEAVAVAVVVYYIGVWLKNKIKFLQDFCIPEPVVGGLLFALLKFSLYELGICKLSFDDKLLMFFMSMFFTSIGFAAKISFVRRGGKVLFLLAGLCAVLVLCQNVIAVGIAEALGLHPLLGLAAGSMPMVGGHGSAGVFGPALEAMGIAGAHTSAMSMATFGLIMGGLLGGPVGGRLIQKHNLQGLSVDEALAAKRNTEAENAATEESFSSTDAMMMRGFALLLFSMGVGSIVMDVGEHFDVFLPPYAGSIFVAAVLRNIERSNRSSMRYIPMKEIVLFADIGLNIFLSMALMSLNLWQLAGLAGPLSAIAVAQTLFMAFFTSYIIFPLLKSTYDAAVIAAAFCGFGLGAMPTAMANMQSLVKRFGAAPLAFILVPIVGSIADGINGTVIVLFINLFK